MSVVFLKDTAVHYESIGRGRPVFFLHTWIGTWRYWIPAMQVASASHGTYALDLLGFGDTARDPAGYSLQQQADLLLGFMDEMGIDRTAIVGHGLGALVGLRMAATHPARVVRMLAVCLPVDPGPVSDRLMASTPLDMLTLLADALTPEQEILESAVDPLAMRVTSEGSMILGDLDALRQADIPCLLLYGGQDPLVDASIAEGAFGTTSNLHQIVLEAAGHYPMIAVSDAFNRIMVDFLALEEGGDLRELKLKEEWRRRIR